MKSRREKFRQWARQRPAAVRVQLRTLKPWHVYRIKATGQIARLCSFSEDGTCSVYTCDMFGIAHYKVFGLKSGELERYTAGKGE